MSQSTSDPERIREEMFAGRRIADSVYCGRCGYNLRSLPYCYHCPECGSEYNARPLVMKGIHVPFVGGLPAVVGSFVKALIFLGITPIFAIPAIYSRPIHSLAIVAAVLVAATGVGHIVQGFDRAKRWLLTRTIARQIADEEGEEQGWRSV